MQVETVQNNLTHQLDIFGRWLSVIVLVVVVAAFLLAKFRAGEPWHGAFEVWGRVRHACWA